MYLDPIPHRAAPYEEFFSWSSRQHCPMEVASMFLSHVADSFLTIDSYIPTHIRLISLKIHQHAPYCERISFFQRGATAFLLFSPRQNRQWGWNASLHPTHAIRSVINSSPVIYPTPKSRRRRCECELNLTIVVVIIIIIILLKTTLQSQTVTIHTELDGKATKHRQLPVF